LLPYRAKSDYVTNALEDAKQGNWRPKAAKQLLKLPKSAQFTIRDDVNDKLPLFPNCPGVKKLTNHAYSYRLRVGAYRVFFEFDGSVYY
jgi:mRNA-degrading endonuclease RelE of RelBE toxin-antitoxin system